MKEYNYMKMLCSKLSRNQIIEDLAIKCEELYLARESILKKDKEIERLNNIINELEQFMKMQQELYISVLSKRPENDSEYNTQYATMVGNEQLSIVLDKLKELKENK